MGCAHSNMGRVAPDNSAIFQALERIEKKQEQILAAITGDKNFERAAREEIIRTGHYFEMFQNMFFYLVINGRNKISKSKLKDVNDNESEQHSACER